MVGDIEHLMASIHPEVEKLVKKSLQVTLHNMIAHRRDELEELEQIGQTFGSDQNFGSW